MHYSRSFIIIAFIASLVLPGSAGAIMLDLSSDNPTFATDYASGTLFTDPVGLGWDLTVTSTGDRTLLTNAVGVGVAGSGGAGMNPGEWIDFGFDPAALLAGFTIANGNGDLLGYAINGGISVLQYIIGNQATIDVMATASSLRIEFSDVSPSNSNGFRVASLSFNDVPEPPVIVLLGIGLLGIGAARLIRMKKFA